MVIVKFRQNRPVHCVVKRVFFGAHVQVKCLKIIGLICYMDIKLCGESPIASCYTDRYVSHLQAVSNVALIGACQQRKVKDIRCHIVHLRVVEDLVGPAPLIKS